MEGTNLPEAPQDLGNRMLDSGVSEGGNAVELADGATPLPQSLNLVREEQDNSGVGCSGGSDFITNSPDVDEDVDKEVAFFPREALADSDSEEEDIEGARRVCSRSSTFSERSADSCDSFVSAASRLEPFAEREELHKMFDTFDENGDGRISREELGNTMKKLGYEISELELESMVAAVDNDGDGYVNFDEFLALYSTLYYDEHSNTKVRPDLAEDEQELREAFNVFDKNKDGYISVVELQAVLSSLGLKEGAKLADCQRMIKAVDTDGDGQVNFDEFKSMMSSAFFRQEQQ